MRHLSHEVATRRPKPGDHRNADVGSVLIGDVRPDALNLPADRRVQTGMEDKMSSAVEFLARNGGSTNGNAAALEKRFGNEARISVLERRIAELERQNARTQELATEFLAFLSVPAALIAFSPQTWTAWFAWLYVIAVGHELMKRLFRLLMS